MAINMTKLKKTPFACAKLRGDPVEMYSILVGIVRNNDKNNCIHFNFKSKNFNIRTIADIYWE